MIIMTTKKKLTGWSCPLAATVTLRDGTVLETLRDVAALMTERLPPARQEKSVWQTTARMLLEACESGRKSDIAHATAQLRRALEIEGW